MAKVKRALISVSDKTGIVDFSRELQKLGVEILSTGGTAKALRDGGIEVTEVSDFTGFPEIMDGRVKTLHPKIYGGILSIRDNETHQRELSENGLSEIDLVVVNLYPFESTVAKPDCTFDDAIENIDIGGPSMVRASAKNHAFVSIVVDPLDYKIVIDELKDAGEVSRETRSRLAKKAFMLTARYDRAISDYLANCGEKKDGNTFPQSMTLNLKKIQGLRYGENPHQMAAFYADGHTSEPSLVSAKQLQGKELSYNNIADADAAIEMLRELGNSPYGCIIVKHANPCGAAVSKQSVNDAFLKAFICDSKSAFGGIVAVSSEIDADLAEEMAKIYFEVVVAPSFSDEALKVYSKKKNVRLLELPQLIKKQTVEGLSFKRVVGGVLVQGRDPFVKSVREGRVVTARKPTADELNALDLGWRIVKHVKSNAIVFSDADRLLGVGAGQMSRVDSVKIANSKWKESQTGSPRVVALASDAFFPFPDGVEEAAKAGATAIVQPGGSIKDDDVIKKADELGLAMIFTGERHFRH
ncbi:MAG: bifunctional phosphoribosylaminoimidazolecarboxamide formyltransferase/IMP cyclohydrolase [Pseudomonadota bacterium]